MSRLYQETLELEGSVRSLTRRLITVANPLRPDEAITFSMGETSDGSINAGVNGTPGGAAGNDGWWRCTSPHVRLVRVGEMAGNLEGDYSRTSWYGLGEPRSVPIRKAAFRQNRGSVPSQSIHCRDSTNSPQWFKW